MTSRPGSDDKSPSRDTNDVVQPSPPHRRDEHEPDEPRPSAMSRADKPTLSGIPRANVRFGDQIRSALNGPLSPTTADRVFPVRSVVSVEPTPTPSGKSEQRYDGYFPSISRSRRRSMGGASVTSSVSTRNGSTANERRSNVRKSLDDARAKPGGQGSNENPDVEAASDEPQPAVPQSHRQPLQQLFAPVGSEGSERQSRPQSERPSSTRSSSNRSVRSTADEAGGYMTARFKHIVTEHGHAVITGRGGETLQRCEDEPIHIPGAVQGFGLLIALEEQSEGKLLVRVVSENSKRLIGFTPQQLFALDSFTDILSEDQTDNLLDHVDFIRDDDADVTVNGPEVFTMSIRSPQRRNQKLWCAMHINDRHPNLLICEFELEDDISNPLVPPNEATPEPPEDTLDSNPTAEEYAESTQNFSKPLRVLRSARKRKGEAAAMEVFNVMSQVQEQLAAAPNLEKFLKILVGVVKELTGFHRVMIYQFDQTWNGRVVTELVDPRATKDLYKGLNFPASDIPKQAREMYKLNKVRMLYDRDLETARLVCRTIEDLETPLDLTYSYLRAMSPIHLKYLANMAVRSSMSISINAFEELWGLIACHSYGSKGTRVSFPIRKMCRLVGDSASRNIERLSYASRLQARKLINTAPTSSNPSGYIIASSEDLLKLFDADFGLLSIRDETKMLGHLEETQEALAMLEYFRMRRVTTVSTSQDIKDDFPDLRYPPGFKFIAGLLLVPLSASGQDFIVFFRKGQVREVKWAGNPYEKFVKEGTEGYLEPRKSFRTWSEQVVGTCREWTEDEVETAAVLCLVYGKFIEVWRQKEQALQSSQLTRLLLANSAHEVRTPLNAIINYLEIAMEGSLDHETRENLSKSHSASKSLIYVINDLLDLTKTEEGGDLVKDEIFDLKATLTEATDLFHGDAKRKNIAYAITNCPGLPGHVIGDQRRVRQAISNVTANAIQHTQEGSVKVEMYVASWEDNRCEVEVSITDTGVGMNSKQLDALFRELEQVQSEQEQSLKDVVVVDPATQPESPVEEGSKALGLGLAVVARIVRNMNGQLRLKSEMGTGSRFVIRFPFEVPDAEPKQYVLDSGSANGVSTPQTEVPNGPLTPPVAGAEVTLVERGSAMKHDRKEGSMMSRKRSMESMMSKRSIGSVRSARSNFSFNSAHSGRSEADRLIEAIQEPHYVHNRSASRMGNTGSPLPGTSGSLRPRLEQRRTVAGDDGTGSPIRLRSQSLDATPLAPHLREQNVDKPGEASVEGQSQPVRAVRMPDGAVSSPGATQKRVVSASAAELPHSDYSQLPDKADEPASASHMRVLVAEDDPVNSRIIKKRLEKLGHEVFLTVNGEECSSTYGDKSGFFDLVLMDMQMPIVDGLTSTKMIRSFEKSHPTHLLSTRASLNTRVPIIAVSASLIEKERPMYVDAGFDGWILKPIIFPRLSEIMSGMVDKMARRNNLYKPGRWEMGGWFQEAQKDIFAANTKPSQAPPTSAPGHTADSEGVKIAAAVDDPAVKEEGESRQSREQQRLLAVQEKQRAGEGKGNEQPLKARTWPPLGGRLSRGEETSPDSDATITDGQRQASPAPMTPRGEPS